MDRFLEACGAVEPLRLEVGGVRQGRRRRVLGRSFVVLGRTPMADIRLRHGQISLRHVYLQLVQGRLACFDLSGRAGVQWDDGRPARSGWLDLGRTIRVGPFEVRQAPREGSARAVQPTLPDLPSPLNVRWEGSGPDVVLEFPDEATGPARWRMTRSITLVGRAPGCRVRLPDQSVSWYHCSLVRTPDGVWVVDLLSRGGLTVNGFPVRYGRLEDGDLLQVGGFRIVPRYETQAGWRSPADQARGSSAASVPMLGMSEIPASAFPPPAVPSLVPRLSLGTPVPVEAPLSPELVELLTSAAGGSPNPALVMLIDQFGRMQQQMLEQFHQSMMLFLQHIGDRHQDQMRQVREEVSRLRELSDELGLLQERLQLAVPGAAPAAPLPSARAAVAGGNGPAPPGRPAALGSQAKSAASFAATGPAASEARGPARKDAVPSEGARQPAGRGGHEDPLVMVSRRISEIRSEQRSRWQRILDMVRPR
jgi:pSer/pThr/pTyr-binding forkhead associated (FHA) protein